MNPLWDTIGLQGKRIWNTTGGTIHDDDLIAKIMAHQNPGLPDDKQDELWLQQYIAAASV
jgi:hypothetical protein